MNITVKPYEASDHEAVIEFMKKVTAPDEINLDIIQNAVLVKGDNGVTGMVSFEAIDQIGVIRYFIYDQFTQPDLLVNMFFELYARAKAKDVNQLVAMAKNTYANQLFGLLGFIEIKKSADLKIAELVNDEDISVMSIRL